MLEKNISSSQTIAETVLSWLREPFTDEHTFGNRFWSDSDWREAQFQVQLHGLGPLFYSILTKNNLLDEFQPPFQQFLLENYTQNKLRIKRIQTLLSQLISEAENRCIPMIPLKGSVLIESVYTDPAHRPMADIDVLLSPDRSDEFGRILMELGHQFKEETYIHRVYSDGSTPVSLSCEHPGNPVEIEVHTALRVRFLAGSHDITSAVLNLENDAWPGCAHVRRLRAPALMFHLACHLAQHQYHGAFRAIQAHDLSRVAQTMTEQDWEVVLAAAAAASTRRLLYSAVTAMERFTGYAAPSQATADLSHDAPSRLRIFMHSTPLAQFSMANEDHYMRLIRRTTIKQPAVRLPILQKLRLKQTLYFKMNFAWTGTGWEMARAAARLILPDPPGMEYMYPNWISRFGRFGAYLVHFLLLGVLCTLYLPETGNRYLRLGRKVRDRIANSYLSAIQDPTIDSEPRDRPRDE